MQRIVLGVLVLYSAAWAQAPTGEILGTIRDASGLSAPAAVVAVVNEATGQRLTACSNETGDYIVRALPPGQYSITAEKEGFKKAVRAGVTVTALQNVRVDLTLEVGAVTQSVVVAGEAPLVDTRTSTVGTLIDDKRIVDLPLNGRNILSFAS
jgi:hypothetical protein